MFQPESDLQSALRQAIQKAWDHDPATIPLTYPPNPELGDLASPVCFELARILRKSPRQIAEGIVAAFRPSGAIQKLELAGGGYLNAFFDRASLLRDMLELGFGHAPAPTDDKVIVEHTNINPNKAAHIGHLRNAVLGDTLVRCLRRLGHRVEIQNYIDDTGVQLCDLVVGFLILRGEGLDVVREKYDLARLNREGLRFDYIAWDLYAEVTRFYDQDKERLKHREEVIHAVEAGGNATSELAALLAHRLVQHHLLTMQRLGIVYDVTPQESDILKLHFWDKAFERLKSSGAIQLAADGKNAGCWVMDLPGVEGGVGEDQKVIVRSNGSVTYVGKDIAYQMWKFGVLGRDFHYKPFDWAPHAPAYSLWTTHSGEDSAERPQFGNASLVYNVIDTRQAYLQRVVAAGLRSLGHDSEADRSIHFSYDMVALTPTAVLSMFPDYPLTDEEKSKAYLEMSGRKGLGVRADDLLDTLFARARDEIAKRNPEMDAEHLDDTARAISVGALRYYMLRFSRNRVVAFDLDAALSFEGETGPYLQYSIVRARNILAKMEQEFGAETSAAHLAGVSRLNDLPPEAIGDHWNLALALLRVESTLRQAVDTLELATVAKHAYSLAQAFNSFYHKYPVSREADEGQRTTRMGIVRLFHDGMIDLLGLMGIVVPDRM